MAWLGTWAKRIKLDIDYTNKIGASVTQFPVTIHLKAANGDTENIFSEVGANSQKIAITQSDGTTQLYAEVELWDNTNSVAIIHTSLSTWTISADTSIYLYYDNTQADNTTYIGDTPGSSPASNVWDSNFVMVQHMNDATTSSVLDSTGNNNDGTKGSANNPLQADGKIGKGQNFSADYITLPNNASLLDNDYITIEQWVYYVPVSANPRFVAFDHDPNSGYGYVQTMCLDNGYANVAYSEMKISGTGRGCLSANNTIAENAWTNFVMTYDGSYIRHYINGALVTTSSLYSGTLDPLQPRYELVLGRSNGMDYMSGTMDEIRISNIARSAAWSKASYNSGNDSLLTYGEEEGGTTTVVKDIICSNGLIVFPR